MTVQTETHFQCSDLTGLRRFWRREFEEHELEVREPDPRTLIAQSEFAMVTLHLSAARCCLQVAQADPDILPDIRAGIEEHMAEFSPELVPLTWSGTIQAGAHPPSFVEASVASCAPLGVSWYRMTLAAAPEALRRFAGENWHFRLLRRRQTTRPPIWPMQNAKGTIDWPAGEDALTDRVFTTRYLSCATGELVFDIFRHPGGPTSDWAAKAPIGERVGLLGPGGKAGPEAHPGAQLIVGGDETAVPAILRGLSNTPAALIRKAVLLVESPQDHQPVPGGAKIDWLYRAEGATEADLVHAVTEVSPDPGAPCHLWFAASQDAARSIRTHGRRQLKLSRDQMLVSAYWS